MLPTFNVRGDILVTEYISPRLNLLQKGDVVVATKPTNPRVSILKRIVGMPGDHVETMLSGTHSISTVTVPKDHVWLEGDNKGQSTDSRDYGPVPMCLVRGRVWIRFWPLAQFCVVRRKFFGRDAYAGAGVAPRGLAAAADGDADFQVAAASEDQGG